MSESDEVQQAWARLGLPGDPPRDPKDATLFVPLSFGSIRDSGDRCEACGESINVAVVCGIGAETVFTIGTLRVCGCDPDKGTA